MKQEDKKLVVSLLEDSAPSKNKRDTKNILIRDMFEEGFTVAEPYGPRQVHSKLLVQAFGQLSTMMKFLDFDIKAQGATPENVKAVTGGFSTIADTGGIDECFRDKGGIAQNLLLYGDAYFTVNLNDDEKEKTKVPIVFSNYSNSNVVLDNNATRMRGRAGKAVTKAMVYSQFTIEEAKRIFGEDVIGDSKGKIPKNNQSLTDLEKDDSQNFNEEKDIEVGYFWDLSLKKYIVFCGSDMKEIEQHSGDDYPFMLDGIPYIPIFNFICFYSAKGVTNHGIGDYIYELALVSQRLFNLGIHHSYRGANPTPIINLPQGTAKKFIQQMDSANRNVAKGKDSYAIVEYDPMNPPASAVHATSIATQSQINEWQMIFDRLVNELKRMGINVDAVDRGSNVTASQIISEEEARGALVKQIMEANASETQKLIDVSLELLKTGVSVKNKTPIQVEIPVDDNGATVDNITIGDVVEELKHKQYYAGVNSRTGVFPSNIMRQARLSRLLPNTKEGTPAYYKMMKEFSELNDHAFTLEDFKMAEQAPSGGAPEITGDTPMSGTDRMAINPRQKNPEPAL